MSQRGTLIFCTHVLAVTLLTSATTLRADDSKAPEGYKTVYVGSGDKKMPIFVKDQGDPLSKTHMGTDPLDHQKAFSETNSMSNKVFAVPGSTFNKSADEDKNSFITKPYLDQNAQAAKAFQTVATRPANFSKANHDFSHDYFTAGADEQSRHAAMADATSADQNRSAVLGGPEKQDLPVVTAYNKQYLGPGATKVPEEVLIKENLVLTRITDVPNRPLTMDEVRNLINNGTKPNLDEKPDEPSKALNDPDYKPEPLRGDPSPPPIPSYMRAIDNDKDDAVPAPGMMSNPPENSEPLPQH